MMLYKPWSRGRRHAAESTLLRRTTLTLAAMLACGLSVANAQTSNIIKVEEDWELDVATPDPAADIPQVVCVFGPADPANSTHALFEINHSTAPSYQPGGMQLQCWWQDSLLGYGNHPNNRQFDAAVDQISFTTRTQLKGGQLILEIDKGVSVNWGAFGGQGYLKVALNTWRENLNTYNSGHSIAHSRITYGKHRVNQFVRTEVRYYTADGLDHTEPDDVVIYSQAAASE